MKTLSVDEDDQHTHTTTTVKVRRRVHGQATKIEREIFYKGAVYIIEEELYSDSEKSSIYTSEDSFLRKGRHQ